jgi:hypothetical protein
MYIAKIEYFRMHFSFRMRAYFGGHSKKKKSTVQYIGVYRTIDTMKRMQDLLLLNSYKAYIKLTAARVN